MDRTNDVILKVTSSNGRIKLKTDADRNITLSDNTRHDFRGGSLTSIILPYATRADFPKVGSKNYFYLDLETGDMYTFGYIDQSYTSVGIATGDIIDGNDVTQEGAADAENDSDQG